MNNSPTNTWELAELLESVAKTLKSSPNYYFKANNKPRENLSSQKNKEKFENMGIEELKNECEKRGIKLSRNIKRRETIIKKLKDYDSSNTSIFEKITKAFDSD